VLEVGEGIDKSLIGRKVAFMGSGWATHNIVNSPYFMPLDDNL
jgi:hypothetical protein